MPKTIHGLLLLCTLACVCPALRAAPVQAPELEVILEPVIFRGQAEISAVDVAIRVERSATSDMPPLRMPPLRMPHVVTNVETVAAQIEVTASDSRGALRLIAVDEGKGAEVVRSWHPQRPIQGSLRLRYRAPIGNLLATRGAAPPTELRSEAGAFSGAGGTFLLLPESTDAYRISVRWNLAGLPRGAVGVSSFGVGDIVVPGTAPVERLSRSFFMGGRVGLHPRKPTGRGFFAAWQGEPPFDARALLEWTETLHAEYSKLFADPEVPRYGVFVRRNRVNPGGGIGLIHSFVATYDVATKGEDLRILMAHEMFHTWSPQITQPGGLASSWFGEGLAVFYQRALPRRFGMIDAQTFLADVNFHAGRYFTNALGDADNAMVPMRFWEDTRIRTIPYDRGSFYMTIVDYEMRKRSAGQRSLDDLMLEMRRLQSSGQRLTNANWEALLIREHGDDAALKFRAMLAGQWQIPESDAFGPCYRRVSKPMRRFVLGFEPKVLTETPRIVRDLIPGSAADLAGLLNGDEILKPVGQDHLQGEQHRLIELKIRRGGQDSTLRYLPRGETVDAWQWERDLAASAANCPA